MPCGEHGWRFIFREDLLSVVRTLFAAIHFDHDRKLQLLEEIDYLRQLLVLRMLAPPSQSLGLVFRALELVFSMSYPGRVKWRRIHPNIFLTLDQRLSLIPSVSDTEIVYLTIRTLEFLFASPIRYTVIK